MTNKTITKRASALQSLAQGLQIRKGQLVPTEALIEGLRLADELSKDLDAFYGSIKTFLEVHNLPNNEGDWGYLKLSPQRRLYADSSVKPRFLKTTIDTAEVRHYQKNHKDKLPAGVTEQVSNRLIKKIKEDK